MLRACNAKGELLDLKAIRKHYNDPELLRIIYSPSLAVLSIADDASRTAGFV
jgi:hypothetical protein